MTETRSVPTISSTFRAVTAPVPKMLSGTGGAVLFMAVFLALAKISYLDVPRPFAVMAWNPSLGVCVAVALLWGRVSLPLILVAPLLGTVLISGFPLTIYYAAFAILLILAKVFVTVWGANLIARTSSNALLRDRQAAALLATVPVTLLLNFVQAAGLMPFGLLSADKLIATTERLWIGDLIGIFVQTPFCVLALRLAQEKLTLRWPWVLEVALQSVLVGGMVWFIFGLHRSDASEYFYLLFLPMIWIVLNHGLNGAIMLNMLVQVSTISYLLLTGPAPGDLIYFQALAVVLVASSLTLGLSVDQSRAATQRLRAREQEVAASQKAAATTELAGALAHELSHPIGALSNYAVALTQLVGKTADADPALATIVTKLRQEARRATDTLRRLREFFRSGSLAMEPLDVGGLMRDAVALVATRLSGRSITMRITGDTVPLTVLVDRIQLLGVLHNLLLNAIEAVEAMAPEARHIVMATGRRGDDIYIAISDSGPGIAPDVRDHIFEALTTTKSYGLGLGLSISRSVVQAHGGRVELGQSELGGAKFVIVLPVEKIEVQS